jgi:hypothetical protein
MIDLTPDPRVLVALTHTPLEPLDALCELIDNSIDSFIEAERRGSPVTFPLITVELPGGTEVTRNGGVVRVRDNGSGLSLEATERALRAGYSGKSGGGTLGLFGMGFNIASGKLGRRTQFTTARKDGDTLRVRIDLDDIVKSGSYRVPITRLEKIPQLEHGTVVEVSHWWAEGNANHSFIRKLAGYSKQAVRDEIGRRYATILRKNKIRITVNGSPCEAFEHCVWGEDRFVERQGHGRIPAQFLFNQVLANAKECVLCGMRIPMADTVCPECKSESFRTLEERVYGWVGIQRFDDQTNFGIDLIRNGRAIRTWEQSAFFEYTDEFKKTIKDYPIDSQYGRIVGEVHLDHVPVDFLKQDFERTSEEWRKAVVFLRGESSLQPQQLNAQFNQSPIFKLYQGYRKVRDAGSHVLYMGVNVNGKPKRISRDVEKEYYEKFLARLPGYYDDSEWWKLVEQADRPPIPQTIECPQCHAQNLESAEECTVCGKVLIGKDCVSCGVLVARAAVSCPECGASQVPEIRVPWKCDVCAGSNDVSDERCQQCGSTRGTPAPCSLESLLANSDKDDDLSIGSFTMRLPDDTNASAMDVETYVSRTPLTPKWGAEAVPAVTFRSAGRIQVFIDTRHRAFAALEVRPEEVIALELADFLISGNSRLVASDSKRFNSVVLATRILDERWGEVLETNPDRLKEAIRSFFGGVKLVLRGSVKETAREIFENLSESQVEGVVRNLVAHRRSPEVGPLVSNAEYILFLDDATIVDVFKQFPEEFFDGKVFAAPYNRPDIPGIEIAQSQARRMYQNCLEDLANFLTLEDPGAAILRRAKGSLQLLESGFA